MFYYSFLTLSPIPPGCRKCHPITPGISKVCEMFQDPLLRQGMGLATSIHSVAQTCRSPHLFPASMLRQCLSRPGAQCLRLSGSHSSLGACCLCTCCQEAGLAPVVEGLPISCRKNCFLVSEQAMEGNLISFAPLGYLAIPGNHLHLCSLQTP